MPGREVPPISKEATPAAARSAGVNEERIDDGLVLSKSESKMGTTITAKLQMKAVVDAGVVSKDIACAQYAIAQYVPTSNPPRKRDGFDFATAKR
mmetsp:Transcript_33990/g.49369  ORF Transcript_33990/g.49369 Transcript_33990/m.49369 type:complete len:95 (+) Transcript_33990:175-459(+)